MKSSPLPSPNPTPSSKSHPISTTPPPLNSFPPRRSNIRLRRRFHLSRRISSRRRPTAGSRSHRRRRQRISNPFKRRFAAQIRRRRQTQFASPRPHSPHLHLLHPPHSRRRIHRRVRQHF